MGSFLDVTKGLRKPSDYADLPCSVMILDFDEIRNETRHGSADFKFSVRGIENLSHGWIIFRIQKNIAEHKALSHFSY